MSSRHAGQRRGNGKRAAFRAWRHSRPFWGGLLMLLAGLELLSIPLSGVLIKGQVKLVIYIGIGGVFGVLIGVLLIVAGLVVWFNPAHRVFYGIAGIVLGILSFPASNLGGFFLGMLLAIIGGALAFAWTPNEPPASGWSAPGGYHGMTDTRSDLPTVEEIPRWSGGTRRPPGFGSRMMAVAVLPCALGLMCSSSNPSSTPTSNPSSAPTTAGTSGGQALPGAIPSPSAVVKNATQAATNAVTNAAKAATKAAANAVPKKAATQNVAVKQVSAPAGLVAPSATSVLTAQSSTMSKLNFVGVATLPVGGGGSEKVLEFTASSASLSAVNIRVTQDGKTVNTRTASVGFPNGMTLYTTKMCGQLAGVAPNICFTPDTISQLALKLASVLGGATPLTMTNVTANQFLNLAPTARWGGLSMATA